MMNKYLYRYRHRGDRLSAIPVAILNTCDHSEMLGAPRREGGLQGKTFLQKLKPTLSFLPFAL